MRGAGKWISLTLALMATPALAAEPPVTLKTYPVSGATGMELYESIGRNGPKGGDSGAIAQTVMNLKWKRLFDERSGDCYLVKLQPVVTITMILPKPKGALSGDLKARWTRFADGVRSHEDVHVDMIRTFLAQAQASAAGAMVRGDKSCAKVKAEVSRRLDEALAAHKARNRDFDRLELSDGGNVHRLILNLVE